MKRRTEAVRTYLRKKNLLILVFFLLYLGSLALIEIDRQQNIMPGAVLVIVTALPLIFITLVIANILVRIVGPRIIGFFRDELEPEQRIFFAKLFDILVYVGAVGFLLYAWGVTGQVLATYLGFVTVGFALAIREFVVSFFVWLIILNKRPFRIGHTVRIGAYEGKVDRIGTFFITLSSVQRMDAPSTRRDQVVKVPNKTLLDVSVENLTHASRVVRMQLQKLPGDIAKLERGVLKDVRKIVPDATVQFENRNDPAGDRRYIAVTYAGEEQPEILKLLARHARKHQ